jgi:hypothetical protein
MGTEEILKDGEGSGGDGADAAPLTFTAWVLFTAEGIPAWYGPDPVEGAELVDDLPINAPALMRVKGEWVPRPPPPPPTEADLAAQRDYRARLQAEAEIEARRLREDDFVRRSGPDQLLRAMGKITIAELTARVAVIRADVEAGR